MTAGRQTIIQLENVNFSTGGREILRQIDLSVCRNDFLAVTGPNGGGKTTMLRLILKLLKPTSGNISYLTPDGLPTERLHIGYLPQKNMIDSRFPITVREVIESGLMSLKGLSKTEKKERVEEVLDTIDMRSHIANPIGALSGGQLQRVLLGRALVSNPPVLVLDEPLSYLDKHFEERTYEILENYRSNRTIILVSHEMSRIANMANRHIIVDHTVHECHGSHHFVACDCD